jgi:hypothetical protein
MVKYAYFLKTKNGLVILRKQLDQFNKNVRLFWLLENIL